MKIVGLYTYPVKSLRGISLTHTQVDTIGLAGDRRWMVVDADGNFQTIRKNPIMTQIEVEVTEEGIIMRHPTYGEDSLFRPSAAAENRSVRVWKDTVMAKAVETGPNKYLSQILGQEVFLVYLKNTNARVVDPAFGLADDYTSFSDGFPILITTTSSLQYLNRHLQKSVDMQRFRPNVIIENSEPWIEDTWRTIRIGKMTFRIAKPCSRCVVTTRDHENGEQIDHTEPLKTLGEFHRASNGNIIFGQNTIPNEIGELSVGDIVEVVSYGKSNLLAPL